MPSQGAWQKIDLCYAHQNCSAQANSFFVAGTLDEVGGIFFLPSTSLIFFKYSKGSITNMQLQRMNASQ